MTDNVAEFIELSKRKKGLKVELEEIEDRMKVLDPLIQEEFSQSGTSKVTRNGMTLYVGSQLWAKRKEGVTGAQVCAALEAAGLEEYTTMNHQSFSALLREWNKAGEPIPEALQSVIEGNTVYSVKGRVA